MALPGAVAGCLNSPLCGTAVAIAAERATGALLHKFSDDKRANKEDARAIRDSIKIPDWSISTR